MNKIISRVGLYIVIILLVLGIVQYISNQGEESQIVTYDKFLVEFKKDNVKDLTLKVQGLTYLINGEFKDSKKLFISTAPFDASVVKLITESEIKQTWKKQEGPSIWVTLLTSIIPFVIIFFLFFFLLNQAQGGGGGKVMNFGKSRARLYNDDKKRVTFEDVAGADEEKQELVELVEFLKDPRRFAALGARIPKGVLLVGPPGTGKTLLARAVAGEAGVPFFTISGSDFVEMFVGVGASRVRDLFENAKKNAPCIIFIDEIDAVGRQRGAGLGGGHDEREQTLNQLLVEMDGFGANEGIIIVAATNRPDILDPALLRPGRFDRQITVDRPDIKGREAVLKVHARNKLLNEDVKLDSLARYTIGFSGADLENLLNEAALIAARRNRKDIGMDEVEEAFDRIVVGTQKKNRVVSERERKTVAYHEAGHAVIGHYIENADEVHRVTIVPRGRAGGYVMMFPKDAEDPLITTRTELLDRVTGLLGGRLSEEIFIGEISSGAYSDFKKATAIVRSMIVDYGMSDKLGPMQFGSSQGQVFLGRDIGHEQNYSEAIAYEIDKEMQSFIRVCYERGREVLQKYEDKVHLVAKTLIEKETLEKDEIRHLLEEGTLPEKDKGKEVKVNIQENERDSNELEFDKTSDDQGDKDKE
jgi:cell division protease FtsH